MSHQTLAQQLIEVLRLAGVVRVLGVVGDSLHPVVDAIRRTDGIDWVHVRHQEVGAVCRGRRGADAAADPHRGRRCLGARGTRDLMHLPAAHPTTASAPRLGASFPDLGPGPRRGACVNA